MKSLNKSLNKILNKNKNKNKNNITLNIKNRKIKKLKKTKVNSFANSVYEITKTVPKGSVTTYKSIGEKLGTRGYQAIGQALRNNPYAPIVPCHRVVASNGTLHGFKGSKSQTSLVQKIKLLESEGVKIKDNKIVNFENICV